MSPTSYQAAPPRVRNSESDYIPQWLLFQVTETMVPRRGLEPLHLTALAPHASVSTNFTISANLLITEEYRCLQALAQWYQQLVLAVLGHLSFPSHLLHPLVLRLNCPE